MSRVFETIIRPILFGLPAETAHELGLEALKLGLVRPWAGGRVVDPRIGPLRRFGLEFNNPLGVAAGFDKNARVVNELAGLGFGFVEVGTVTLRPQPGNEKPRLFRLPKDGALLNRLGFNNDGAVEVARRLEKLERRCIVGVNIGRNKDVDNEDAAANYIAAFDILQPLADYVAINVSSPNTPNLRELQRSENLVELLSAIQDRNQQLTPRPLLVKIAPDLTEHELRSIVQACIELGIDGLIATNTTVSREGLAAQNVESLGAGGISGRPLRERSTSVVAAVQKIAAGRLPVIGVGGIFDAADAFEKIAAGASLVQAYTGFVFGGPGFPGAVNAGLAEMVSARGYDSIDEAVGSAA
ncbi:MAG: quinone-dependent dihydroorotate dehydrogenase [Pyrinomonadaceae bacterium]